MLINWETVLKHCPKITGIIHVGAHRAEERKIYGDIPTKWVEADLELFNTLPVPPETKYHFAACNHIGTERLNIMPFKAANSLLMPNLNKRRADVYVEDTITVPADMIRNIQEEGYNFINLDIQGAELNALKGTDLRQIDYVYTEAHDGVETYWGCTQYSELIEYLKDFEVVAEVFTKYKWGDVLFVRK